MQTESAVQNFEQTYDRAVQFWQAREYGQARAVLEDLFCDAQDLSSRNIARTEIMRAIVEEDDGHPLEALRHLRAVYPLLRPDDDQLLGAYFNTLAVAHHMLKNVGQAFQEYTAASYHHGQAKDFRRVAETENNIGLLHIEVGEPGGAYEHFDKALTSCDDPVMFHQIGDSIARAKLAEGKTLEAYDFVSRSCAYFRQIGAQALFESSAATMRLVCEQIEFERECARIREALDKARGNPEDAARRLGITRQALDKKLKKPRYKHLAEQRQPYQKPRGKSAK